MNAHNNRTVNVLKGVSIIFILVTHFSWNQQERLLFVFPYIINMAVPILMIISGYVYAGSFRKRGIDSLSKAYERGLIIRRFVRYICPFVFVIVFEIIDPNIVIPGDGFIGVVRWILVGTIGPGSYYIPLMIQFIFIFPLIYFGLRNSNNYKTIKTLAISFIIEILIWAYGIGDDSYRLLITRYIFEISIGVLAAYYPVSLWTSVVFTAVGGGIHLYCYIYCVRKRFISWMAKHFHVCKLVYLSYSCIFNQE